MPHEIAPIAVRPSTLSGLSENMVVSHYQNDYGNAVRALNAVGRELAMLDSGTPPYRLRGLKREELSLMGSVELHELYFSNLGGFTRAGANAGLGSSDWHEIPDVFAEAIAADFGTVGLWRRDFVTAAQSLSGGSGWVLLTYSRRQRRFWNQIATDHTQTAVDAAPVLVLLEIQHAAHPVMNFGEYRGTTLFQVAQIDPDYIRSLALTAQRPQVRAAAIQIVRALEASERPVARRRSPRSSSARREG